MRLTAVALLAAAWVAPAVAQPTTPTAAKPVESVTVTGARSRKVIEDFVQSFSAPTRLTGKLTRWEDGVCPVTAGLKPVFTKFISQHLKDVAAQAGAPVGAASCKPNIEIVFTTKPQALLDNIRKKDEAFLGYADTSAQADALAKVTHPIQAWYTTASSDLRGNIHVDSSKLAMGGAPIEVPCPDCPDGKMRLYNISAGSVTGSRLGDGMRSSLYHVIIVAEPAKLLDYEMGSLADYISMLALTQLASLDTCQSLPSIVNMLATNCDHPASALSASDLGYLRGLYKMSPGRTLRSQQDEVIYQMELSQKGD